MSSDERPYEDYFMKAARTFDDRALREAILAGSSDGSNPWVPHMPTLAWQPTDAILDLGCGLLRNLPLLTARARFVSCWDRAPMIVRAGGARVFAEGDTIVRITSVLEQALFPWPNLVFACLVLQHMDRTAFDECFQTLRRGTPAGRSLDLYVYGRERFDAPPSDALGAKTVSKSLYHRGFKFKVGVAFGANTCEVFDGGTPTATARFLNLGDDNPEIHTEALWSRTW